MSTAAKNPSIFIKTAPIILGTAMVQLAVGINAVLFPVTLQSFGYSKTLIGACLSLEVLAVVVISQYLSTIIARVGIGRALIIATLVRATCLYILSSSDNYAVWLICVFFFGMNTNIMLISLQTWINTIPLKNNKGLVIGIFSSALSLGTAAGPLIASLSGTEGRLLFFIDIAIVGLTALPFMLIYRSIPSIAAPPRPRILYAIQTAKIYMFSAFVGGITFFGLPAFLTIYGMMNNLSIEKSAFLISMFMLGSIGLGFLIASVSDRVNRLYVIISCVFVGLIAAIYLPLAIYSYPQALILLFIWGGVSGGIYATGLARVGELFRREDQVSANVAYSLMDCLGGVAGVLLIGGTMDLTGSDGLIYVILMAAIAYFIYILSCYKID